jgi:hypothetical protein
LKTPYAGDLIIVNHLVEDQDSLSASPRPLGRSASSRANVVEEV